VNLVWAGKRRRERGRREMEIRLHFDLFEKKTI
jgi:hypothetical protein